LAVWKWEAVDENRGVHRGAWEETDENAVLSRLWKQKLYPVRIRKLIFSWLWTQRGAWDRKLYWARTTRKIGTMLEAGIPLLTILEIMADKEKVPSRESLWKKVSRVIQTGDDFSEGLKEFYPPPGEFLEIMIKTGEKTGTLAACFLEAAGQLEEEYFFDKKMKTALFYPVLLLVTALAVVYILSILILPMYENLFQGFNAELPYISKLLINAGSKIPWIIGIVILSIAGLRRFRKKRLRGIPGMGRINKHKAVMQFCSILRRFIQTGLPLLESFTLLGQMVKDKELEKLIRELKFAVAEGKKIFPVLAGSEYFPPEAAAMLGVAEESGRFSEMLAYTAQVYQRELQEGLESYARIVEPVLILGMAGLVGMVAVGILLPIFDISMHIQ